jgi:hypothetical protein
MDKTTIIDPSRFPIIIRFSFKSTDAFCFFIGIIMFIYIFYIHPVHLTFEHVAHRFETAPMLPTLTNFMTIIGVPLFLLYVALVLCTMQITLDKDTITYKNFFIQGRIYRYDAIEEAKVFYRRGGKFLELIPITGKDLKKIVIPMDSLSKEDSQILAALFKIK